MKSAFHRSSLPSFGEHRATLLLLQGFAVLVVLIAMTIRLSPVSAQAFTCPSILKCDTPTNPEGQTFRIKVNRTYTPNIDPTGFVESYDIQQITEFGTLTGPKYNCPGYSTVTSFYLKAKNSNLYLTNSGSNAIQSDYAASPEQSWNFDATGAGNYWLRNMLDPTAGQVLDVYGAGLTGTKVIIYSKKTPGGDANQRFIQTDRGSGFVSLHPVHDPTSALDVSGESTASGTQIQSWTYHGGDNQLWSKSPSCTQYVNSPYTCRFSIMGETGYTYLNFDALGQATISKEGLDPVTCYLTTHGTPV